MRLGLGIIARFRLGGRDIADWFEQPAVAEPVDPFERGELNRLEAAPWPAPVDHLGLEQAVDRLGERIVGELDLEPGVFSNGSRARPGSITLHAPKKSGNHSRGTRLNSTKRELSVSVSSKR